MKQKLALLLAALLAVGSTLGCLDAHSLDQYGYVLSIGFDQGETLPYSITLMIENTQSESDSQTSSGFTLVEAECRNLFEAEETLVSAMPYRLNFSRTELIVISHKLLEKEGELENLLNFSTAQLRIRYNACLFASLSSAKDALDGLKNDLDPNLARLQKNFVTYGEETGLIPVTNLMALQESLSGKRFDALIPICGKQEGDEKPTAPVTGDSVGQLEYAYIGGKLMVKSGMKTGLAGAAILQNGAMCGLLAGQRVQLVRMVCGFEMARMQLKTPKGQNVSASFEENGRAKIQLRLFPEPYALVTVPVTAVIEQNTAGEDLETPEGVDWIAQTLSKATGEVFDCCQKLGADTFGFGKEAAGCFHDTAAWNSYDWKTAYGQMKAEFVYVVSIKQSTDRSVLE